MSSYEMLNPAQQEAVCHVDGPLLILAGAGSGKTRVLTHRVAYLIEECNVNPWNIFAITFTNKAAREMRERVDAIVDFGAEDVWVSTFHSACVRMLRRFGDRIGWDKRFSIYDTDDQKTVMREVCKQLEIDTKTMKERAILSEISSAKNEMIGPEEYKKLAGRDFRKLRIADAYAAYQERLHHNQAMDFDDLLLQTVELFKQAPDVLEFYQDRLRYIMVDEYQDTNSVQFELVRMLADKYRNLCVVGDDDQSIYKFRGANIRNILDFEKHFPDAKVIKLEENYRSTKTILNAANAVIRHNNGRKEKTLRTENEEGVRIAFHQYQNEYEEAEGIISDIQRKRRTEQANYSDFAILYRTNAQARALEEKFVYAGLPYRVVGGVNFYQRKEIKDMIAYLKVIDSGIDDVSVRRIVNVPRRGIGAASLQKAADFAENSGMSLFEALRGADRIPELKRSAAKIHVFTDLIQVFRAKAEYMNLSDLYDSILEDTGYLAELQEEETDEALTRIENLEELRNKIVEYEEGSENPDLSELLEQIALVADIDNVAEDDDRVLLMTLHSAKGLEFPHVYMSGMEDGLFPGYMSMVSDDPDEIEEERRLCYVGITRAQKTLSLSCARTRMRQGERQLNPVSRFVREIPKELIDGRVPSKNAFRAFDDDDGGYAFTAPDPAPAYAPRREKSKPAFKYEIDSFIKKGSQMGGTEPDYGEGDRVSHVKFGQGTVVSLEKADNDYNVSVDFDKFGVRKMKASFSKLKKI